MPTNLQIDDKLLNKALRIGGFKTKKDTVNKALEEYIRKREQVTITALFGEIEFSEGFDHKALRARR